MARRSESAGFIISQYFNFMEFKKLSKKPANHGTPWTKQQDAQMRKLVKENTPTRVVGLKLGRTEAAVQGHVSEIGMSLKPTNHSPYNRREK